MSKPTAPEPHELDIELPALTGPKRLRALAGRFFARAEVSANAARADDLTDDGRRNVLLQDAVDCREVGTRYELTAASVEAGLSAQIMALSRQGSSSTALAQAMTAAGMQPGGMVARPPVPAGEAPSEPVDGRVEKQRKTIEGLLEEKKALGVEVRKERDRADGAGQELGRAQSLVSDKARRIEELERRVAELEILVDMVKPLEDEPALERWSDAVDNLRGRVPLRAAGDPPGPLSNAVDQIVDAGAEIESEWRRYAQTQITKAREEIREEIRAEFAAEATSLLNAHADSRREWEENARLEGIDAALESAKQIARDMEAQDAGGTFSVPLSALRKNLVSLRNRMVPRVDGEKIAGDIEPELDPTVRPEHKAQGPESDAAIGSIATKSHVEGSACECIACRLEAIGTPAGEGMLEVSIESFLEIVSEDDDVPEDVIAGARRELEESMKSGRDPRKVTIARVAPGPLGLLQALAARAGIPMPPRGADMKPGA